MAERLTDLPDSELPQRTDRYAITSMPDQETLQDFLRGLSGQGVSVMFNLETGVFDRTMTREEAESIRQTEDNLPSIGHDTINP